MFKKCFLLNFLVVLSFILTNSLNANEEEKRNSLYYFKLGVATPPGMSNYVSDLPNICIGARFQKNYYGVDLSANITSIVVINYFSLKSVFLLYPLPEKKHQLYLGLGPGAGYEVDIFREYGSLNLEGVLGYEFRHHRHFKTFVQFEISQPVFSGSPYNSKYVPGIALSIGAGF